MAFSKVSYNVIVHLIGSKITVFLFPFFSSMNSHSDLPPVPNEFVCLVKSLLSQMAGAGKIDSQFVNQDFWRGFPKKFRQKRSYVSKEPKEGVKVSTFTPLYFT